MNSPLNAAQDYEPLHQDQVKTMGNTSLLLDAGSSPMPHLYGQPYYIEALLLANQPRWAANGVVGGVPGTPVTLTYSFMEQLPVYYGNSEFFLDSFTAEERDFIRQALDVWSEVSNITFIEVPDTGNGGTIRFGLTWENGPACGWSYCVSNSPQGGDIWLNWQSVSIHNLAPGTEGFLTLIHEIGHSLGLQDTSDPDPGTVLLPGNEENNQYTVMSYDDHPGTWGVYAQTPLLYDIAAIQYLYGANTTTQAGDTIYSWAPDSTIIQTIWDGGGNDTISTANQTVGATIDLQAGHFSSIGSDIDIVTGASYGNAFDNIAIAFGVTIENAIGSPHSDSIFGNAVANILQGNAGNDWIAGFGGDDILDGGPGEDFMEGGLGNDQYFFDGTDDIWENPGEGIDTVISTASVTLANSAIENLILVDGQPLDGSGNELNNTITGNSNRNYLSGGSGNDLLSGLAGDDSLIGEAGDDVLDGGSGADYMAGGLGNDHYFFDNLEDNILENPGEGIDTVTSTIAVTLANSAVENLILADGQPLDGSGNELNNTITGNSNRNYLSGGSGNDLLSGLAGDDVLDGEMGADYMAGGLGNDHYFFDNLEDNILENPGEGIDTVTSTIAVTLTNSAVENLVLADVGVLTGSGNELNNTLLGNGSNNTLSGGKGDDLLLGNAGNDVLKGEEGKDLLDGFNGSGKRRSEIDLLAGGADRDIYVLGSRNYGIYYRGKASHALIQGWQPCDRIQILGNSRQYSLETDTFGGRSALDTLIYYRHELIGVVLDSTKINLNKHFVSA